MIVWYIHKTLLKGRLKFHSHLIPCGTALEALALDRKIRLSLITIINIFQRFTSNLTATTRVAISKIDKRCNTTFLGSNYFFSAR